MTALTFYAAGEPAPKGSLRHVGHGRLVEQVKRSKPWRETVTLAAAAARDQAAWVQLVGVPVVVEARVLVTRPKTVRREHPITRSSGDSDKHARNILDAITDAGLIGDDSQVIDLHITKAFADEPHRAGAVITVRPAEGTDPWTDQPSRRDLPRVPRAIPAAASSGRAHGTTAATA